jgi:hypothetical protein
MIYLSQDFHVDKCLFKSLHIFTSAVYNPTQKFMETTVAALCKFESIRAARISIAHSLIKESHVENWCPADIERPCQPDFLYTYQEYPHDLKKLVKFSIF